MSFIKDAFSTPKVKEADPVPTRDTAADDPETALKKRIASGFGAGTVLLSGPGGVSGELTGTRQSYG